MLVLYPRIGSFVLRLTAILVLSIEKLSPVTMHVTRLWWLQSRCVVLGGIVGDSSLFRSYTDVHEAVRVRRWCS